MFGGGQNDERGIPVCIIMQATRVPGTWYSWYQGTVPGTIRYDTPRTILSISQFTTTGTYDQVHDPEECSEPDTWPVPG
jgi:hypothetical protein